MQENFSEMAPIVMERLALEKMKAPVAATEDRQRAGR